MAYFQWFEHSRSQSRGKKSDIGDYFAQALLVWLCVKMKAMDVTGSGVRHYASKSDYLKKKPAASKLVEAAPKNVIDKNPEAKSSDVKGEATKTPIKESSVEKNLESSASSSSSGALEVAGKVAKGVMEGPPIPKSLPKISSSSKSSKVEKREPLRLNRPAIIFVEGMSMFDLSSSGSGLSKMAEHIPGAETYSWSDRDEIVQSIMKRPPGQPVILVGHSFGGDTLVEVANELNRIENGFKKIDLLVTLDSVGLNNDIIPQNVKKNLNFIGDDFLSFFNDQPNIARNTQHTDVQNELRLDGHRRIDESEEVQMKIFESIDTTLKGAIRARDLRQLLHTNLIKENLSTKNL